jgi:hypothetical protein
MRYLLVLALAITVWQATAWADLIGSSTGGQGDIRLAIDSVAIALPPDIRPIISRVRVNIEKLDGTLLAALNYSQDVCKYPQYLDCDGATSADVKPFLSAELDKRKGREAKEENRWTFFVASGGLGVSFFSLVVTALGMHRTQARKKRNK